VGYDRVDIGGGATGISPARTGARRHARVAMVQAGPVGGDCTFVGCVPSKTLIEAAAQGCEARLVGVDRVEVGTRQLTARQMVIATGAGPAIPAIPGLDSLDVLTNETVFELTERPASLVVIGGGPVGADRKVTLAGTDPVGVRVELDDGTSMASERILAAVGRRPATACMGLDTTGVDVDERGYARTDDHLRTTASSIWAAGDLTGRLQFTHAAVDHFPGPSGEPTLVMRTRVGPGPLALTTHAYPTWSVAVRQAAAQLFSEVGGRQAHPARTEPSPHRHRKDR